MRWNATLSPGPQPLWVQIAERLRASIASGEFRPGEILPSEAEINAAFKVSRATARASLDRLRQDGLIVRRAGRGSIVLTPHVERPATQLVSFSEDMRRRGLRASYATFSAGMTALSDEAAAALGLPPGVAAFRIVRLLFANDAPMGLHESWLAESRLRPRPPTPEELDRGSLYAWLRQHCGVRIAGGREIVEASTADATAARRLAVEPGAALLVARRRSHDEAGAAVEYAVMQFRGDRYRVCIDMTRR